jgi:hypothetical protein
MKVSIKGFITCKSAEQYIDCADNYAVNKSSHRFSVSDGVSKSFFPKVWSDVLVTKFVERTDLKESELINVCQDEWQKRIDEIVSLPETKWFTKSQYNRKDPALATFVGLQFFEKEKKWAASARGDSFLFFVPKGYKDYQKDLIKLSSKSEPIVFDNFPDYFASIGDNHKGKIEILRNQNIVYGTFFLMKDALSEWFINEGERAIGKIIVWNSQADFQRFISQAIDENEMTNDDCAILCIEVSEVNKNGIEYEKDQVTDLIDLINDQEVENEKNKQKKLKEEKLKLEKESEFKKAKEIEVSQRELLTSNSLDKEIKEELNKEGLITKGFNTIKELLTGRDKKEETNESLTEQKVDSEPIDTFEQNSGQLEKTNEKQNNQKTIVDENLNPENDKKEELEKEKVEEDIKNDDEKTVDENLGSKEQPKVDSKAKDIFDKF